MRGWQRGLALVALFGSFWFHGCSLVQRGRVPTQPTAVPGELVLVGREFVGPPPFSARELRQLQRRFSFPVEGGEVSSSFGRRRGRYHDGVDIRAPEGTPVRAAWDGEVVFVGWLRGYGKTVAVRHPRRLLTLYAHLKHTRVRRGQRVRSGEVIGAVGASGRATAPNLHFEIRHANVAWNPEVFLGRRVLAQRVSRDYRGGRTR